MNLIGISVKHKLFGEGVVVSNDKNYFTVEFKNNKKKFVYPDAFNKHLKAKEVNIDQRIKYELKNNIIRNKQQYHKLQKNFQDLKVNSKKTMKSKTKIHPRVNIAFKCNFCDGGKCDKQVGFNGVCSDEIIRNNIELEKRTWCSSKDSDCKKYLKGNMSRSELEEVCNTGGYVCYESQLLRDWKAFAGIVQTGEKKDQPMKLKKVQKNSLCVLTTRDPNSKECDRYIFGVFLVDENYEGDNQDEGYVTTRSKYRIKLSSKEAHKMLFWNYYANSNKPQKVVWSSGLHRYFEDDQAIQILQDIAMLKQGTKEEELAKEFLLYFARVNNIDIKSISKKCGALIKSIR